jgi:hypothetical protein
MPRQNCIKLKGSPGEGLQPLIQYNGEVASITLMPERPSGMHSGSIDKSGLHPLQQSIDC